MVKQVYLNSWTTMQWPLANPPTTPQCDLPFARLLNQPQNHPGCSLKPGPSRFVLLAYLHGQARGPPPHPSTMVPVFVVDEKRDRV
jgi:hypothetical protein